MTDKINPPEAKTLEPVNTTAHSGIQLSQKKKKTPKFLSVTELESVVRILAAADKITLDEAIRKINSMCEAGNLIIVPFLGVRK